MRVLKILFKSLLALIVLLVIVGFFLPSSTAVSRSVRIDTTPQKIFPYVNDFRQFNRWSPWATIDPDTRYEFSGPETGVGSRFEWTSDDPAVGEGSQEIIESVPPGKVVTSLEFDGQDDAVATYLLEPASDGTEVTWQFNVEWGYNPLGRYMGLMMDRLVGASYEDGLQKLKLLVESE